MRARMALACAALLLSGCSTVGNLLSKTGQVWMNPSIPVGEPQDRPTQIALSLYAAHDVNPNPVSAATATETVEAAEQQDVRGSYTVNLSSPSKGELIDTLQTLLQGLQTEDGTAAGSPQPRVGNQAARSARAAHSPADVPLDLGQYRQGASLPTAKPESPPMSAFSTPAFFRVIQLKDDSMLESADIELVRKDPKKALGSTFVSADDYVLAPGQFKFIEFSPVEAKTRYLAVVADFHDPHAARWYDVFRIESRGRKYALLVTLQDTRVAITDEAYRPGHGAHSARGAAIPTPSKP